MAVAVAFDVVDDVAVDVDVVALIVNVSVSPLQSSSFCCRSCDCRPGYDPMIVTWQFLVCFGNSTCL